MDSKMMKALVDPLQTHSGTPTGLCFFETDLSVVTTPIFLNKMLRVFGCDAPFFQFACDNP